MIYSDLAVIWNFKSIPNRGGVYIIWNSINKRFYIGSSWNMRSRFKSHLSCLIRNKHTNRDFQECFNKHGIKAFEFAVLIQNDGKETLIAQEREWMIRYGVPKNPLSYNRFLAGDYFGRVSNANN